MAFQRNQSNRHRWFNGLVERSRREKAPEIDVRASVQFALRQGSCREMPPAVSEQVNWIESLVYCFSLRPVQVVTGLWLLAVLLSLSFGFMDNPASATANMDPITQFLLTER